MLSSRAPCRTEHARQTVQTPPTPAPRGGIELCSSPRTRLTFYIFHLHSPRARPWKKNFKKKFQFLADKSYHQSMADTNEPTLAVRTATRLESPSLMDEIFVVVANGGSLIELCSAWDIRYSDVVLWIYRSKDRKEFYENALRARGEYFVQRLLDELRKIGTVDIRSAYSEDNTLLDLKAMPPEVAACIVGVEVFEEYSGRGDDRELTGYTKKVKFSDKLRGIELLMKNLGMLIDRKEWNVGKETLEQLVAASRAPQPAVQATAAPAGGTAVTGELVRTEDEVRL